MNLFLIQLRRRALLFGLIVLLLTAIIAFQAISVSALRSVQKQVGAISGQYTTIAVPREGTQWKTIFRQEGSDEEVPLLRQKTEIPGLLAEDRRALLKAHVTGCSSVSAYEKDFFSNDAYDAFSRAFSVLAVRCTTVFEAESSGFKTLPDEDTGGFQTEEYVQRDFFAEFSLEEIVCAFPAYREVLPQFKVLNGYGPYPADGKVPFEEGKTYLLFGSLFPGHKEFSGFDENGNMLFDFADSERAAFYYTMVKADQSDFEAVCRGEFSNFTHSWSLAEIDDDVYAYRMDEGYLPYSAEYTGSVEDFLNSKNGAIWRDTIIPFCRLNYESAEVILTDNLESLHWFNSGDASVFEGRSFEAAEYANGENVCLISAAYALKNGLSVGDSIGGVLQFSNLQYGYYVRWNYAKHHAMQYLCTV